jgi:dipeptidyl aminopeptidase/acylaminoacyl peptidase
MVSPLTRRTASIVALLTAAATAGAQNRRPMTFMDIMEFKNVGGVALSPDGSKVAYTVSGWEHPNARASTDPAKPDTAKGDKHETRSHVWMVDAVGRTPRQLTFSERGENAPQWSPDGRSLAFLSSRGSGTDVKTQIWILPLDGGEAYQLTMSKENVSGFEWSKDGSRIAFLAVDTLPKTDEAKTARRDDPQVFEENFRLSHAWVIDIATKRATQAGHPTGRASPSRLRRRRCFAIRARTSISLRSATNR